jgi:hypothetical protein
MNRKSGQQLFCGNFLDANIAERNSVTMPGETKETLGEFFAGVW